MITNKQCIWITHQTSDLAVHLHHVNKKQALYISKITIMWKHPTLKFNCNCALMWHSMQICSIITLYSVFPLGENHILHLGYWQWAKYKPAPSRCTSLYMSRAHNGGQLHPTLITQPSLRWLVWNLVHKNMPLLSIHHRQESIVHSS